MIRSRDNSPNREGIKGKEAVETSKDSSLTGWQAERHANLGNTQPYTDNVVLQAVRDINWQSDQSSPNEKPKDPHEYRPVQEAIDSPNKEYPDTWTTVKQEWENHKTCDEYSWDNDAKEDSISGTNWLAPHETDKTNDWVKNGINYTEAFKSIFEGKTAEDTTLYEIVSIIPK